MTVKKPSGLDYLKLAFPNPDLGFNEEVKNPLNLSGYLSKQSQKFDEEFDFHHQEFPVITDVEIKTKEMVANQGIDALAWYCPYSSYGKNWGIYFDVQAIDSYAKYLHRQLIEFGANIHFGQTIKFLYEAVTRHELEHFNVELASAMMIVDENASANSYRVFRSADNYKDFSEVNATHMEFFARSNQKGVKSTSQSVFYYQYMNQPLPAPYSKWEDFDLGYVFVMLEGIFGTLGFSDKLEVARELTGFTGRSKFIKVPQYFWYSNPKSNSFEDSSCKVRLDCKSTISWVKKSEKLFPGQAVSVEPAKDHDIQVKSKSQPMPVKLSCHDWNQIPPHVITQLANVYQIDKIQLMERIRRGK
jgi:hypothetical protein